MENTENKKSKCPHCGKPDFIDEAYIGEDLRCKHCGLSLMPEKKPPPTKRLRNIVLTIGLLLLAIGGVLVLRSEPVRRAYKEAIEQPENTPAPEASAPTLVTEEETVTPVRRPAYEKLYENLSYEETNAILGLAGTKTRSMGRGDTARTTYEWRLQNGAVVRGTFNGDRLTTWEVSAR